MEEEDMTRMRVSIDFQPKLITLVWVYLQNMKIDCLIGGAFQKFCSDMNSCLRLSPWHERHASVLSLFTLVCHPLHPFFLQIPFPHCSLSAMCTRDIFHNSHILRSVDLWVKKCVKSRAFLLRRRVCSPAVWSEPAHNHSRTQNSTRLSKWPLLIVPYWSHWVL